MADAFYPFNSGAYARVYAYYWTAFLVVSWALLAWHVWQTEIVESGEVVGEPVEAVQPTANESAM